MAQAKMKVKALQPFSHGNVDARQGGVYAMNKGDAEALKGAGFAEAADGEPEQTQTDNRPQVKQKGDVVVDDADDLLGDSKVAPEVETKMERAPLNKSKK